VLGGSLGALLSQIPSGNSLEKPQVDPVLNAINRTLNLMERIDAGEELALEELNRQPEDIRTLLAREDLERRMKEMARIDNMKEYRRRLVAEGLAEVDGDFMDAEVALDFPLPVPKSPTTSHRSPKRKNRVSRTEFDGTESNEDPEGQENYPGQRNAAGEQARARNLKRLRDSWRAPNPKRQKLNHDSPRKIIASGNDIIKDESEGGGADDGKRYRLVDPTPGTLVEARWAQNNRWYSAKLQKVDPENEVVVVRWEGNPPSLTQTVKLSSDNELRPHRSQQSFADSKVHPEFNRTLHILLLDSLISDLSLVWSVF